jgi:hypothetical protein
MDKKKLYTEKDVRECMRDMISLAGKDGCKKSQNKISRVLGCVGFFGDDSEITITESDFTKNKALSCLKSNYKRNQAKNSDSHKEFLKKITAFRNSLEKSVALMKDPMVKKLLEERAHKKNKDQKTLTRFQKHLATTDPKNNFMKNHIEHDAMEKYSKTYNRMSELYQEMELAVLSNSFKGNKGRSLKSLYDYVYNLVILYKDLSKENFSILRHKENGEYKPITPGHEFIYIAIQLLNDEALEGGYSEAYTDKNIYIACENAQQRLKLHSK